jgi:hypothetical protein
MNHSGKNCPRDFPEVKFLPEQLFSSYNNLINNASFLPLPLSEGTSRLQSHDKDEFMILRIV